METFNSYFQVLEYDYPEELLSNGESAFSQMVQSTGPANAQYLHNLVFERKENKLTREESMGLEGQRRWLAASSQWAAATQFALSVSLTSLQDNLKGFDIQDKNDILKKTKDAVLTLQDVLEGKHDEVVDDTLQHYHVPRDRWWSALYRIIEGMHILFLHVHDFFQHQFSKTSIGMCKL